MSFSMLYKIIKKNLFINKINFSSTTIQPTSKNKKINKNNTIIANNPELNNNLKKSKSNLKEVIKFDVNALINYTEKEYSEYESNQPIENLIKTEPKIKKFDKRTIGQRNLKLKDKPLIPLTTPSEILYQKTENIYRYDTIQLLEALKSLSLTNENLPKMIFLLNIIRKKKELKHYEAIEVKNCVYYLIENKDKLPFTYKISLFYNLSYMNYFNNDKTIVYDLLNDIMNIIKSAQSNNIIFNIRQLSNLVYAMSLFYKTNPIDFSFYSVYHELEEIIIKYITNIKPSYLCNTIDSQSFSNIILGYSKSQAGSEEFYQILANIASDLNITSSHDLAIIVYSYSNNVNCNENILFSLLPNILSSILKAKPCELVNILRAYNKKGLLDEIQEIEKGVMIGFYNKYKQFNPLDIAYLYNILSERYYKKLTSSIDDEKKEGEKFFHTTHSLIKSLCFTFEGNEISVLMERSKLLSELDFDLYNQLCNQVRYLMEKKKIKGKDLDLIHFQVKDINYNTEGYNRIKEDIESHLRKIKYYF